MAASWQKTSRVWVRLIYSSSSLKDICLCSFQLGYSVHNCTTVCVLLDSGLSITLFFPGRRGIFTGASGLQIAYVSGREAQQEPAPSHCFTPKDISALVAPLLSNSKFRGVDILLSSQWPRGVWQYGNSPVSALLCSFNTRLGYFPERVLMNCLLSCPFAGN